MKNLKNNLLACLLVLLFSTTVFAGIYSVADEKKMGADANVEISKKYEKSKDKAAQKKLEEMGAKIIKNVTRKDFNYTFTLIKMKDYNAFAIPGGYVYFAEELWNIMDDSSREGILAHEITHVDKRHSLNQMEKQMMASIGLSVLLGVTKSSDLAYVAADIANTALTMSYSRSDERMADKNGTDLLIKAGLDPLGVLDSMRKIKRLSGESGSLGIFASHPPTAERVKYLTAYLKEKGIDVPEEKINTILPKDMYGKITDVSTKNGKYKNLSFTSNIKLSIDDIVYVDKFIWDETFSNLVPYSYAKCKIVSINNDIYNLNVVEEYSKSKGKIAKDDVVAKSMIPIDTIAKKDLKADVKTDNK